MTVPRIVIAEPSGPAGAPLLVLGSSLGTSSILWESTAAILRSAFRISTFDLPGHGATPTATARFTIAELALGVLDAIDALGEDTFHYAGVSLGGAIGLQLALTAPGRVLSAAIICSGARIGTAEGWLERSAVVRAQGTASLVVSAASRWFAPGSLERIPVDGGRLLHSLRDADDVGYALCAEALANYDLRPELGSIAPPVLAIWGEHDLVTPRADADRISAGVQRGRVERVDDAAHLVPVEQPEVTAALISRFITRITEGAA